MENKQEFKVIPYRPEYARATVEMWRASKEKALGISEAHSFDDHLYFLDDILAKENSIYLALVDDGARVAGIMATDGRFLNQLYIHIDFQRQGIGSRLLALAKELSRGELQLHTFEVNLGARAFYENHDFRIIGRGNTNEEGLPDFLYQWKQENGAGKS